MTVQGGPALASSRPPWGAILDDMPWSAHPHRSRLRLFAAGLLDDREHDEIGEHLASCETCVCVVGAMPVPEAEALIRQHVPATAPTTMADDAANVVEIAVESTELAVPSSSPLPPELLGHPRYEVLSRLGQGTFGVVFLAEDREKSRKVAIKVLRADLAENPEWLKRLDCEVRSAARLDHPNIVAAFGAARFGRLRSIVMEFVDGIDLDQLLRKSGPLPVAVACELARQAALGLQHAYRKDMIHRDIKPSNLMITEQGQLKILDFGLAKDRDFPAAESRCTVTEAFLGSIDFMAPEQAEDPRTVDIRADIDSLGCSLFALLAGRPPFPLGSEFEKCAAHAHKTPESLRSLRDEVPAALDAVVAKMPAKQPRHRYQSPGEVAEALAPFARGPISDPGLEDDDPTFCVCELDEDPIDEPDPSYVPCWLDENHPAIVSHPAPARPFPSTVEVKVKVADPARTMADLLRVAGRWKRPALVVAGVAALLVFG